MCVLKYNVSRLQGARQRTAAAATAFLGARVRDMSGLPCAYSESYCASMTKVTPRLEDAWAFCPQLSRHTRFCGMYCARTDCGRSTVARNLTQHTRIRRTSLPAVVHVTHEHPASVCTSDPSMRALRPSTPSLALSGKMFAATAHRALPRVDPTCGHQRHSCPSYRRS
jgi:hypothetical protein